MSARWIVALVVLLALVFGPMTLARAAERSPRPALAALHHAKKSKGKKKRKKKTVTPSSNIQYGWGTVSSVPGSGTIRVTGTLLDWELFPFTAKNTLLSISASGTVYASAALCTARSSTCNASGSPGAAFISTGASVVQTGDHVLVELNTSTEAAGAAAAKGIAAPVSMLYDVGGAGPG